ncbi:hypothetical protein ACFW04_014455 [Cataglyphis niger]
MEKRIDAFEMYIYRRMLRISWKQKELMITIKERKTNNIGHVLRGERYELLRLIIKSKIVGKRSIGQRQNS